MYYLNIVISPISIFSILNFYNLCLDRTDETVMLYTIERTTLVGCWKDTKIFGSFCQLAREFLYLNTVKTCKKRKQYTNIMALNLTTVKKIQEDCCHQGETEKENHDRRSKPGNIE